MTELMREWLTQPRAMLAIEVVAALLALLVVVTVARRVLRRRSSTMFDLGAVSTSWLHEVRQSSPYDGRLER